MQSPKFPVTDDHIHIDPVNGRGLEAAKDFLRAGGTHIFLVSKPSWSLSIHPTCGADYAAVFDETLRVASLVEETGIVVFPVLGVHPAEISRLSERMPLAEAIAIMKAGIDCAAGYVRTGRATALKSGRPHYETSPDVWAGKVIVDCHLLIMQTLSLRHLLSLAPIRAKLSMTFYINPRGCQRLRFILRTAGLVNHSQQWVGRSNCSD